MEHISLSKWSENDLPREKLMRFGSSKLSDSELIAILIGSGTRNKTAIDLSKELLDSVGNNLNEFARLNLEDLCRFKGMGPSKSINLLAALELARRRKKSELILDALIKNSMSAFHMLEPLLADLHYEAFFILLLNRQNKVIQTKEISSGGFTGTLVDLRIVFKYALDYRATGIILAHNHPSGNLKPSEQDIQLTNKTIEFAKLLEIQVLDHLIITNNGYFSFADEGIL